MEFKDVTLVRHVLAERHVMVLARLDEQRVARHEIVPLLLHRIVGVPRYEKVHFVKIVEMPVPVGRRRIMLIVLMSKIYVVVYEIEHLLFPLGREMTSRPRPSHIDYIMYV